MKKRIVSAVLALAMALTLLPMSVFAATTTASAAKAPNEMGTGGIVTETLPNGTEKKTVFYEVDATHNTTQTVTRCTTPGDGTGREYGKWYWLDNKTDPQNPVYYEVTSGILAGNNGSGGWYPDLNAFTKTAAADGKKSLRSTSLTLLGTTNLDLSGSDVWTTTSISVDIAGSGTVTINDYITNATVTSKFVTGTPTGTVAAITRTNGSYATTAPGTNALTLNATNVNVGAISLTGRANTVILTNCEAAAISMNGETSTSATVTTAKTFHGQKLTVTNSEIGTVDVKGDGSTVLLTSATGGDAVAIEGNRGTLTIAGASVVGDVTAKSRAASAADTAISGIPTITVSGGTVDSINTTGDLGNGSASVTLNRQTGNTSVGEVEVSKGSVSVASGVTTADITVPDGSVSISGNAAATAAIGTGATTGTLTLGGTTITKLSVSGYGSDIEGITVATGNNLTISQWPTGRNNDFGTVDLGNYAGKGIKGGTFTGAQAFNTAAKQKWVDTTSLLYQVNVPTGKTALYNKDEMGKAIEDIGQTAAAAAAGNIGIIGQALTNKITLKYGTETLAVIGHDALTPIILPSRINGKNIVSWMQVNAGSVVNSYVSGKEYTVPADALELNATNVSEDVSKIISVEAKVAGSDTNIRAELNGTTINLSGAVDAGVGGVTGITLDLTTDVIGTDGNPVKLEGVPVDFKNTTKATQFNSFWTPSNGARIDNGQLVLANGTRYTVNGSGLAVPSGKLTVYEGTTGGVYGVSATLGGRLASWKAEPKNALIEKLSGTGTSFTVGSNTAMAEAINAALSTVTNDTTVENWVKTAQNTVWRSGFKSPDSTNNTVGGYVEHMTPHSGTLSSTDTDGAAIVSAFAQAWLVPYLQVNVTDYDDSGTLTATLVPMYRIDVSDGTDYDPDMAYTVQAGKALSSLTGDMLTNPVKVKFNLGGKFASQYMHQDGKYVYTGATGEWTINHAGTTGLGTIQIDGIDGLIELTNGQTGAKPASGKYDSLQAAVDDTLPETSTAKSEITINGGFGGSCAFTMTGAARTIEIEALGNKDVTCSSSYVTKTAVDGETYTFQLSRDTVVTPGNVEIVVSSASYGSAAASTAMAKAGDVVTITTYPNQGYKVNTITAVASNNSNVAVSSTGAINQYTFTVPQNVTKVTVTPTFVVGDNKATFTVNSSSRGTASVYTGTSDGKVDQGKTVTVNVTPTGGNRTVGLTARANNGATVPTTRTAVNQYTVTVPSGATVVTVTPTFDLDNGTPFTDVLSSHWASPDVSWIYNKGYTTGYGTQYTFAPAVQCTRWEMVTFLWKAAGYPEVNISNPFSDVSPTYPNAQAYKAIMWAASRKLIDTSTGRFNPTAKISRADAVNILYKQAGSPYATTKTGFKDVPTSAYYAKAVSWAEQKGITNGKDNRNTFKPNDTITRQEIAKMLHVAFG